MLTYQDIIDGICAMMHEILPQMTAYIEECPRDFERPSYYLELKKWNCIPAARRLIECDVEFLMQCVAKHDEHDRPDKRQLTDMQTQIMSKLSAGKLPVKDRQLNVSQTVKEAGPNVLSMMLTLHYMDDTDEAQDEYQKIKSVETKIQGG